MKRFDSASFLFVVAIILGLFVMYAASMPCRADEKVVGGKAGRGECCDDAPGYVCPSKGTSTCVSEIHRCTGNDSAKGCWGNKSYPCTNRPACEPQGEDQSCM